MEECLLLVMVQKLHNHLTIMQITSVSSLLVTQRQYTGKRNMHILQHFQSLCGYVVLRRIVVKSKMAKVGSNNFASTYMAIRYMTKAAGLALFPPVSWICDTAVWCWKVLNSQSIVGSKRLQQESADRACFKSPSVRARVCFRAILICLF